MKTFQELLDLFHSHADQEKATKMSTYMRNQFLFLGISAPVRKHLIKEFYQAAKQIKTVDWHFIQQCWASPYREFQYVAIGYLTILRKQLTPNDVPKIKQLAQTKPWWDTIDGIDKLMEEIAFNFPEVKKILVSWSVDEDFWLRRIAIDHQLLRKHETDVQLLEQILLNNLNQTEFFINKAIGWSLRDYSKTNPEWVRAFIEENKTGLSSLSIREASKYL
ncbi:DNA alkylation repair protein [Enterococcus olivae]